MITTPMQTAYRFRANIRPIKYAYFVRDDDWSALTRVMRLVCTQWGGIRSLIIPVTSDLTIAPIMEYLLRLHEPDAFVDYMGDPEQQDTGQHHLLQAHLAKLWPHRAVQLQIGGRSFEKWDRTLHPLGAIADSDKKIELTCHEFGGPQEDEPILLALFGAIYQDQQQDYERTFTLRPARVEIGGKNLWANQFDARPFGSVLNLTSIGIRPREVTGSGSRSNHFDVSIVDSLSSMCMYWNNRATRDAIQFETDMGRRTLLLPMRLLDDQATLRSFVEFIRVRLPYPDVSTNLHIRFNVWSDSDRDKLQAAIATVPGLQRFTEDTISVQHQWSIGKTIGLEDFSERLITYHSTLPEFPQRYLEGLNNRVGRDITLREGANEVFLEPPVEYHNRFGGNVALDLECDLWKRFGKTQSTAERIRKGSWFSRYGLTSVVDVGTRPHYITMNVPSETEALELLFKDRGYQIRVSKPGQYASAVVNLVGGLAGMDIIASRPAYLLLDTLALKSTLKLAQRIIQQLSNRGIILAADLAADIQPLLEDMEIIPELKRIPRTYRQLRSIAELQPYRQDLLSLLARLSEDQVIKRGFYLPCPNCGTPSWHPLAVVDETIICPGCSWRFPLPVEYPVRSEIQWEYTLNTLVNRAMDQDALVSTIALRHLTKTRRVSCLVPGLELLQSDQVKAELDFVFVSEQEIFAGECKAGDTLGDKDIDTARLAADLGMKSFFYCTLASFDDASKQSIQALRDELAAKQSGFTVEVLEGETLLKGGKIDGSQL